MARSPYSTLGLKEGATHQEIRRAYKRLALECHPDKNPGIDEERFREIYRAQAYLLQRLSFAETGATRNVNAAAHERKLKEAADAAFRNYDATMSRLTGPRLVGERDLIDGDRKLRKEAMKTLEKIGSRWPRLLDRFKDELECRMQAQYSQYARERAAREKALEKDLDRFVASVARRYDAHLRRSRTGIPVAAQDPRTRHARYRKVALAEFRRAASQWPHLSSPFQEKLKKLLDHAFEKNARAVILEAAFRRYEDRMSQLTGGHLILQQNLIAVEKMLREEALDSLKQKRPTWLELPKKLTDDLEKRMQTRCEDFVLERNARERAAEADLTAAVASAVGDYDARMRRSSEGALVTGRELAERHEEHRKLALKAFSEEESRWPFISKRFRDQLEEVATTLPPRDFSLVPTIAPFLSRQRLEARYEVHVRERDAREDAVDANLREAVVASACRYDARMTRLGRGVWIGEREFAKNHKECREEAHAAFLVDESRWLHLSKKFQNELDRLIGEAYDRHKRNRDAKGRRAEEELTEALASAVERHRGQLTPFLEGPSLIGWQELRTRHLSCFQQALGAFSQGTRGYPYLSRIYRTRLKQILHSKYEEYKERRSTAEEEAEFQLEKACSSAAEEYKRRRTRFYGAAAVDWRALLADHQDQARASLDAFRSLARGQAPWIAKEYEVVLAKTLDTWHDELEDRMARERTKRKKRSLITLPVTILLATAAANALTNELRLERWSMDEVGYGDVRSGHP
ncbi:unnamed protein product [Darwinula stevensoni]|uniref:J domain-containing protein n=1 Tax=Darwinula stevensoni TaxID=69355 RepID=A0A7R9A497_9CRUS|nr:unnamed protein product [Darwinula stevensoni]CAG0892109.1 unnamed protein product [Darwinula stevensoni]